MTALKRLSLQFLILAALLISSTVSLNNANAKASKASNLSCSACAAAVEGDSRLCSQLRAQAMAKCGVAWVVDPCRVGPSQVCIEGCTCN
jgi:positive regulator of sigma E activity